MTLTEILCFSIDMRGELDDGAKNRADQRIV